MSASTLTVVIPTHNRIATLKQTLYYLESGSVIPDEVIVVDDGSYLPVQSNIEAADYRFPLRIISFDENRGAPCARNAGIRAAKSHLLLLLDDDVWPDHHMIYYHKLMHEKHPALGYGVVGRVVFDPELMRTPLLHFLEEYGPYRWLANLREGEVYSAGIVTPNISLKREFLDEDDLFDEGFPYNRNEDTEFGLRLMERGFEPRFHYGPSARHHSPLSLKDYVNILTQGGYSKAYWANKKPDDTNYCLALERFLRRTQWRDTFQTIYREFVDTLGDDFLQSDVSNCSPAQFEEFCAFLQVAQGWIQDLGIVSGWIETIPGFEQMAEDIREGLDCKDRRKALDHFRNGFARNPEFFPAALLLAKRLQAVNKLDEAHQILDPFRDCIWAKLRLGELDYHLGKDEESLAQFFVVYDRTGHGKSIERQQRAVATKWLLRLLPKTGANDEWVRRLWNDVSEDDKVWNPKWVNDLESAIAGCLEVDQYFGQRFPRFSNLQTLRRRAEILNQVYHREYPIDAIEQYDYLLRYKQPIKLRVARAVKELARRWILR